MRKAARIDGNQTEIVSELRKLDGVSVAVGHDDVIVGFEGRNYWFELKKNNRSNIQPSQLKLLDSWTGHYSIVWSLEMIINEIGFNHVKSRNQ